MQVAIRLRSAHDEEHRAWLTMAVDADPGPRFRAELDVAAAVRADDVCFLHPVEGMIARALRDEILTGLLQARRTIGRPFHARLLALGAAAGQDRRPTAVRPIAFAVAAFLAVAHGLGHLDLTRDPQGGHGWRLEEVRATPSHPPS